MGGSGGNTGRSVTTVKKQNAGAQGYLTRSLHINSPSETSSKELRERGNGLHVAARQELPLLDCAVVSRVQIQTRNDLAGDPALLSQPMQRVLHFDMQGTGKLIGEIAARGTIDK